LKIELTETARGWLADEGYDPQFGARPVRRTLERHVENPLSKRLLAGEFTEGDTVVVDVTKNDEGNSEPVFKKRSPDPIPVELPVQRMANGQ
jgi:ATP-dependent Clp protease ATP-binding subunit ClpA